MQKRLFALALMLLALIFALSACGENSGEASGAPAEAAESAEKAAAVDGLAIETASLTAEPLFIDWEQDGVAMQLLAFKNDDGEVQLAYNTCQSCADSPYAYFEYAGGVLTCQNCGNRFGLDSVGRVAGGCNPKPVSEYAEADGTVVIPTRELAAVAPAFKTWKAF